MSEFRDNYLRLYYLDGLKNERWLDIRPLGENIVILTSGARPLWLPAAIANTLGEALTWMTEKILDLQPFSPPPPPADPDQTTMDFNVSPSTETPFAPVFRTANPPADPETDR
jgi:hypothetical protein